MDSIMQGVGMVGAGLLLLAYAQNARQKWGSTDLPYQLTNMVGAVLICINTYHFKVYGPLVLNIFWALIALNGMRSFLRRRSDERPVQ